MTKARDLANIISGGLTADDIPALPASKITSGSLGADRIPDLPTSKITSGAFADARIPDLATSKITSGTFADARLSSGSVTQHVDLTALSADNLTSGTVPSARLSLSASDVPALATSKITSGTFADARISSSSVTAHVSAVTQASGSWTPAPSNGSFGIDNGARYARVGNLVSVTCWLTGSSQGDTNTNIWYISGLPITPVNTGTASDVVGMGTAYASTGAKHSGVAYVFSNTSYIYLMHGSKIYSADDNSEPANQNNWGDSNGRTTNWNMRGWMSSGSDKGMALEVTYFV